MNQALNIVPRLRRLAELETAQYQLRDGKKTRAPLVAEIESLRALLPTAILSHHDTRRARGKISVAPVTRGICRACYIALPRGRLAELHKVANELNICDNCGAFIYLGEEDQVAVATAPKDRGGETKNNTRAKRVSRRTKTVDETIPAPQCKRTPRKS